MRNDFPQLLKGNCGKLARFEVRTPSFRIGGVLWPGDPLCYNCSNCLDSACICGYYRQSDGKTFCINKAKLDFTCRYLGCKGEGHDFCPESYSCGFYDPDNPQYIGDHLNPDDDDVSSQDDDDDVDSQDDEPYSNYLSEILLNFSLNTGGRRSKSSMMICKALIKEQLLFKI